MKVVVRKTGGFAGLEDRRELDTAQMDAAAAQNLEQTVKRLGFFELPSVMAVDSVGADLFHYEVTAIENDRRHTVTFEDDDNPTSVALRKLVENILKTGSV